MTLGRDDQTETVRQVGAGGGGKVPDRVTGLVRERLLAEACAAAGVFDATHDDIAWETARLEGRA